MDRKKLDDALYALGQTFGFFGKELDELQIAVWKNFLLKHDPDVMMKAMQMHMEKGRYAPKPKDLADYAEQIIGNQQAKIPPVKALPESDCPKELSDAWRWALKIFHGYELYGSDAVDDETAERYLLLVNEHAKHFNQPLAIPDEYKISSVWKCNICSEAIDFNSDFYNFVSRDIPDDDWHKLIEERDTRICEACNKYRENNY